MITVTLGTIPYPFNRITSWLDSLLEEGIITEPVLFQHGNNSVKDLSYRDLVTCVPLLTTTELTERVSASRFVISHAGQGTTRMLAARDTSFVIVPRLSRYGEHIDDHQLMFAQGVEQLGVNVCTTLESLKSAISQPPEPLNKDLFEGDKLSDYLAAKYPNRITFPISNFSMSKQL